MVFQIEFSDITDTAVLAVTLITGASQACEFCTAIGRWQNGPKKRNAMSGEIVRYEFLPSCEIKREKIIEMR